MTKAEAKRMAKSLASGLLIAAASAGVVANEAERTQLSDKDERRLRDAFEDLIAELEAAGNKHAKQD